jgi:hypothetical protein
MRITQHRCLHCQTVYSLNSYSNSPFHNTSHCESCTKIIQEALSVVPPKFEEVLEPIDIPLDLVLGWYKAEIEDFEAHMKAGRLPVRRVAFPLFDLEDPDNQYVTGWVRGQYKWSDYCICFGYWTKRGESSIRAEMEKNLETGELKPWVNYR